VQEQSLIGESQDRSLLLKLDSVGTLEHRGTDPEERSQPDYMWLLWLHRGLLFNCVWKTVLLAVVVSLLIPVRYEAITRLVPGESSNSMSMLSTIASKAAGVGGIDLSGLFGAKTPGAYYVAILQSRTTQDHLINRFDLRKVYSTKYYEGARKKLSAKTNIVEDRKSGVITVTVTDNDAGRAAALARGYVEEVNRLSADLNTSAAHRERVFVENQLKATKQELDTSSKELSEFASKYSAIDIKEQARAMVGAAANLQGELIAAQSQMRGLQAIYSTENIRVRSLQARIDELQRQLQKLGGEYTPTESAVNTKEELYPPIRSLPALGYRYADYYRRAKIAETVFEVLTQQYEIAKIQEAKELPVILVMDQAEVPERKSFPPRMLIVVLSAVGAFVFAGAWVVGRAYWNNLADEDRRKQFSLAMYHDMEPGLRPIRRAFARIWPLKRKSIPANFGDSQV
jgi:capsule polysaccharide export protein KpsE/RkpR